MDEKRPDPGQLLRKLQYEEEEKQKKAKGKLKISWICSGFRKNICDAGSCA